MVNEPSSIKFCPRCDKTYFSAKSEKDALEKVRDHIKNAHPEMLDSWDDEQND